ncbi:MAG: SurA N-terminal domain-containing protein [Candidatus Dadabacteria bacterium]
MSVIQNIRDKYARWAVVAIAISLLGFILMDAFAGRTGLFSGDRSTTIGKVNGKTIDQREFAIKMSDYEKRMQGQGEMGTQQALQDVWNMEVGQRLMQDQYDELGLTVSDKELKDILYGANAPQDIKQRFTDPQTGVFNAVQAQQAINQVSKSGSAEDKKQLSDYINALENQRLAEKYNALLLNSVYVPKWFLEKKNVDNALMAKFNYVSVPYTSVSDSQSKVTDADIQKYLDDHKKDFEQKDETRSVNYVAFSAAPSAADSAATRNSMATWKQQLDTAKDYDGLIRSTGSQMPFYNSFISKKNIQNPNKDSILSAPVGVVYGPYIDNGYYEISKIVEVRNIPDTVKVRHILIATQQPNQQTGQMVQVRDDASAKHLIDSVQTLLNQGQNFDSLVVKFSEDPGSKDKGGVYDNVYTGQMVAPFNDFIFTHGVGEKGVVKTDFGYHLIEILSQKGSSPGYKIVYLSKPIIASQETDDQANNNANMFAGNSKDAKSFNENFEKNWKNKGYNKLVANDIKPLDFSLVGMQGSSRALIKKIFEAKKGDIVGPERMGDNYVVAVVTEVDKAGLPSPSKVRGMIEPVLRNKKKAEIIKKNMTGASDLNSLAAKVGQPVQNVDSVSFNGGNKLAFESKVVGAAFNPANKGKVSPPIDGQAGVYVINVENVYTTAVPSASVEDQRRMYEQQAKQSYRSPVEVLEKTADIKDYRAKFY